MTTIDTELHIDVTNICENDIITIANNSDKSVKRLIVTLYNGETVVDLADCTVTAAFVVDGVLVKDDVSCSVNTTYNKIYVTLTDALSGVSGQLLVQLSITDGTYTLVTPLPMVIKLTSDIVKAANVTYKSYGTVAEIMKEVAAARGDYSNLATALAVKADKATTLSGYGITDAYTKTNTDTLLAAKADSADVYNKAAANTLLKAKSDIATTSVLYDSSWQPIYTFTATNLSGGFAANYPNAAFAYLYGADTLTIGGGAFTGCTKLTDIWTNLSEDKVTISNSAFADADKVSIYYNNPTGIINQLLKAGVGLYNNKADKATTLAGYGIENIDAGLSSYTPTWVTGYYVSSSGELKTNSGFAYVDIDLSAGKTLQATLYGNANGGIAVLSEKNADGTITVINAPASADAVNVTYVAQTDTTVRLCSRGYADKAVILTGYLCVNMLAHSEEFISGSNVGLRRLTENDYTKVDGKYINYNGDLHTLSGYAYYDIDLKAYETIEAYVMGNGKNVALLSTFGDDGTLIPYIISTDNTAKIITYTSEKAETIRISSWIKYMSRPPYFKKGYTSIADVFDSVNAQVQELAEKADVLKYRTMFYNCACIGDSITRGARGSSYTVTDKFSYPTQLQRQSGGAITTTNLGHSGATALSYWQNWGSTDDYSGYDTVIIELGTNGSSGTSERMTDTIDADVTGDDYTAYADTSTGRYCSLIEKIKEQSPHAYIFMCSSYVPVALTDGTNDVLKKIAEKYGCKWIDLSAFAYQTVPNAWMAEDNYHPSDIGYAKLADIILRQMCAHVIADPDYFNTHSWQTTTESEE